MIGSLCASLICEWSNQVTMEIGTKTGGIQGSLCEDLELEA